MPAVFAAANNISQLYPKKHSIERTTRGILTKLLGSSVGGPMKLRSLLLTTNRMKLSKRVLVVSGVAGLLLAAPAFVPLPQYHSVKVAAIGLCGVPIVSRTIDSANARPLVVPCPVQIQPTTTPWAPIVMGASVVSVMINAAIIYQTQCRELTFQEAYASTLPVIGWLFNQQNNQCGHQGHR